MYALTLHTLPLIRLNDLYSLQKYADHTTLPSPNEWLSNTLQLLAEKADELSVHYLNC